MFAKVRGAERPGLGPVGIAASRFMANVGRSTRIRGRKKKELEPSKENWDKAKEASRNREDISAPQEYSLHCSWCKFVFLG